MGEIFLGLLSVALSTTSGLCLGDSAYKAIRRKRLKTVALIEENEGIRRYAARKGIPAFYGIAEHLLRYKRISSSVSSITDLFVQGGYKTDKRAIASSLIGAILATAIILWMVSGSAVFGIAGTLSLVGILIVYANHVRERQSLAIREQVPDALRALMASFKSGHSLMQALEESSSDVNGRLGGLFGIAVDRMRLGSPTTEALSALCSDERLPELSFLALALDVQHRSGGNLGPVLDSAMDSVECELALMRKLKVQTAQAKLSANVVTVMPFVLVALFSVASPGFLSPFFDSVGGMCLLALALAMQLSGILIVRRMLRCEVS